MASIDSPQSYYDFKGLAQLKTRAASGEEGEPVVREVATQFESIFLHMILKTMREATNSMRSELLDSQSVRTYEEMFDQQLAVELSKRGSTGLADQIVSYLTQNERNSAKGDLPGSQGVPLNKPPADGISIDKSDSRGISLNPNSAQDFLLKRTAGRKLGDTE